MLSGAALHTHALDRTVHCAKIDHRGDEPCIFRCEIHALHSQRDANTQPQAPASNR
jgi:hypothetical protein